MPAASDSATGYDGSMWLHLTAPVTVRCGPVSSGSEEKGLVRAGATSSRHTAADGQGGATSRRPSGPNSSRPSHRDLDHLPEPPHRLPAHQMPAIVAKSAQIGQLRTQPV